MYFTMGELHQTRTTIEHTFIVFLQPLSHLGDDDEVYMADLEVIHMPGYSEFLILDNIVCDTWVVGF